MNTPLRNLAWRLLRLYRAYKTTAAPTPFLIRRFLARIPARVGFQGPVDWCVDVGAGVAPYQRDVVRSLGVRRYLALEIAPSDRTRLVGDACRLPLRDGSVDLVVSFEAIQHVPDSGQALDEMSRVLRPGGHLVVTFPFLYGECDLRDHRRWTMFGMCEELRRRGLSIAAVERRGGFLFAIATTLSWMAHHLVPGGRTSWRAERNLAGVARELAVALVTLPTTLLEWLMLAIDRFLPETGYYTGGIVLARADVAGDHPRAGGSPGLGRPSRES